MPEDIGRAVFQNFLMSKITKWSLLGPERTIIFINNEGISLSKEELIVLLCCKWKDDILFVTKKFSMFIA